MPVDPVPEQYGSVTPSLTVSPCADAIEFYVRAFAAVETAPRMTGPDGRVAHAEIRIGDAIVMLSDEAPESPTRSPRTAGATTAVMFIYTDEVDAMWERAVAAGAKQIFPLELQFYGDKGDASRTRSGTSGDWLSTSRTSARRRWNAGRPTTSASDSSFFSRPRRSADRGDGLRSGRPGAVAPSRGVG